MSFFVCLVSVLVCKGVSCRLVALNKQKAQVEIGGMWHQFELLSWYFLHVFKVIEVSVFVQLVSVMVLKGSSVHLVLNKQRWRSKEAGYNIYLLCFNVFFAGHSALSRFPPRCSISSVAYTILLTGSFQHKIICYNYRFPFGVY